MPLTSQEALLSALRFLKTARRDLACPISEVPVRQRLVQDADPPRWEFYFEHQPPASVLVDPSCARVCVDLVTGSAEFFPPRLHRPA